jgi:hypothetical protein
VQNLRQLRLFAPNPECASLFNKRGVAANVVQICGGVIAPSRATRVLFLFISASTYRAPKQPFVTGVPKSPYVIYLLERYMDDAPCGDGAQST